MIQLTSWQKLVLAGLVVCVALLLAISLSPAGTTLAGWTDPIEESLGPVWQPRVGKLSTVAGWTDPIEEGVSPLSNPRIEQPATVAGWTDPIEEGAEPWGFMPTNAGQG